MTTRNVVLVVLGVFLLFIVWEYAPPMWGGLLLLALVVPLTMKALQAGNGPARVTTGTF